MIISLFFFLELFCILFLYLFYKNVVKKYVAYLYYYNIIFLWRETFALTISTIRLKKIISKL